MAEARKGRIEDQRLVTGLGRFTDDMAVKALFAVFVRAEVASARVLGVDTDAARAMPGVAAVLTATDLAEDGVGPVQVDMKIAGPDGHEWRATPRHLLVRQRVRHIGEPLAIVIADSLSRAMDAAEAVEVELEELGAVTTLDEALAENSPLVHEDRPGNLCLEWQRGDWDAAGAAIAAAAHQVRLSTPISRVSAVPMEPRSAIAGPIGGGRMEIVCSHQNPMALRPALADAFAMRPEEIRCHTGDVGGSFGMKSGPMREEFVLFWAARRLGRHLRWRASRGESFLSDEAARDVRIVSELGMDADGVFTAMRFHMQVNAGAYGTTRAIIPIANFGGVAGVYRTPLIAGRVTGVLSHTVPTAPYRGAGRPEATLAVEALIDRAARECGFDRIELRRRNLIPREAMPWKSPFIFDYDCGDFEQVMDAGLAAADVSGFAGRRAEAAQRGCVRGLGIAMCVETAGGMYQNPGRDFSNVEIHADGNVTLAMGTFSAGAGIETVMTDIAAQALGIAPSRIAYRQGDTDLLAEGKGMGGSAAMPQGSSALKDGVAKVIGIARDVAGEMLEADIADIGFEAGAFRVVGTDRAVDLAEVARAAQERGIRLLGEGSFAPEAPTFPNGCHICEVEIDPETGLCRIAAYTGAEDIGTVVNHQLAEGQIHGGVVQGLGQALCEELRYSGGEGQLLSGSFMDYAMPRAADMPTLRCGFVPVPTRINPMGVKGVGEAGTVGALAAGMSAIADALAELGVETFAMPATPGRVWEAIRSARQPE